MVLRGILRAFVTKGLAGQVIQGKMARQTTFVTEGQRVVTRRLEAVTVAGKQIC
jgi:hypothetical protein